MGGGGDQEEDEAADNDNNGRYCHNQRQPDRRTLLPQPVHQRGKHDSHDHGDDNLVNELIDKNRAAGTPLAVFSRGDYNELHYKGELQGTFLEVEQDGRKIIRDHEPAEEVAALHAKYPRISFDTKD